MQVVVPQQLPPNRMLVVQAPSGQRIQVQVPPNVQPGQAIQVQVPAAAAPAMQTIEVVVPPGVAPGQQIRVQSPSGQTVAVMIPPGMQPGMKMRVQVPAPAASTPPAAPTPPSAPPAGSPADPAAQSSSGTAGGDSARELSASAGDVSEGFDLADFDPSASMSDASTRRKQEAAAAEAEAAAERRAEAAAAAAEKEKEKADAAAAAASMSSADRMALVAEQAAKLVDEAEKAAAAAGAAVEEAQKSADAAQASAEEAGKAADVAPGPAAASRNAANLAASRVEAAVEAAEAAAGAAKETAAAAASAKVAKSADEVEGAAAAARGAASTARISKSKAEAAAKHAKKAASAAAAALEAAEEKAYASMAKVRAHVIAETIASMAFEVATEAYADNKARIAEEEADVHLTADLGGQKALDKSKIAANRCIVCGDFTTNADQRGGKCLYCHDNPGQMDPQSGLPMALAAHAQMEKVKESTQAKLQLAMAETPLSLVAEELQRVTDEARDDSVGIMYIDHASTKLRKLDEQAKATAKLHGALVKAEQAPGSASRAMLSQVIADAAAAGVKIDTVLEAYRRLHALERSPVYEAEATLAWLATQTELEADTLADAAAAAEAMAGGKLDEGNRALRDAREALSKARKKHAELEVASSNVLLFSAPRPIDDFAAVDIALGDARQAGVDRGVGLRVGVKQAEPPAMFFHDVMQTNLSAAGVAAAELERVTAEASDAQYNAAEAAEAFKRMEAVVEKQVKAAAEIADEIKAVEYQVRYFSPPLPSLPRQPSLAR